MVEEESEILFHTAALKNEILSKAKLKFQSCFKPVYFHSIPHGTNNKKKQVNHGNTVTVFLRFLFYVT